MTRPIKRIVIVGMIVCRAHAVRFTPGAVIRISMHRGMTDRSEGVEAQQHFVFTGLGSCG